MSNARQLRLSDRKPIKCLEYQVLVANDPKPIKLLFHLPNPSIPDDVLTDFLTKPCGSLVGAQPHSPASQDFFSALERQFEGEIFEKAAVHKGVDTLECAIPRCKKAATMLIHCMRYAGVFDKEEKGIWEPSVFDVVAPCCGDETMKVKGLLEQLVHGELNVGGEVSLFNCFFDFQMPDANKKVTRARMRAKID